MTSITSKPKSSVASRIRPKGNVGGRTRPWEETPLMRIASTSLWTIRWARWEPVRTLTTSGSSETKSRLSMGVAVPATTSLGRCLNHRSLSCSPCMCLMCPDPSPRCLSLRKARPRPKRVLRRSQQLTSLIWTNLRPRPCPARRRSCPRTPCIQGRRRRRLIRRARRARWAMTSLSPPGPALRRHPGWLKS